MTHHENLADLAAMHSRLDAALNLLAHLTREAAGQPNWSFLQSRARDLRARISTICEDAQVAAFDRRGFYAPKEAVYERPKRTTRPSRSAADSRRPDIVGGRGAA